MCVWDRVCVCVCNVHRAIVTKYSRCVFIAKRPVWSRRFSQRPRVIFTDALNRVWLQTNHSVFSFLKFKKIEQPNIIIDRNRPPFYIEESTNVYNTFPHSKRTTPNDRHRFEFCVLATNGVVPCLTHPSHCEWQIKIAVDWNGVKWTSCIAPSLSQTCGLGIKITSI